MEFFTKKHQGFTLIELLVVIAIIGILASIVLVSLGGARDKAKDARIVSSIAQIRTEAELINSEYGLYASTTLCCGTGCDADVITLCTDINDQNPDETFPNGGGNINVAPTGDSYCVEANLNATAGPNQWYCADSTGRADYFTSDPLCSSATTSCGF